MMEGRRWAGFRGSARRALRAEPPAKRRLGNHEAANPFLPLGVGGPEEVQIEGCSLSTPY